MASVKANLLKQTFLIVLLMAWAKGAEASSLQQSVVIDRSEFCRVAGANLYYDLALSDTNDDGTNEIVAVSNKEITILSQRGDIIRRVKHGGEGYAVCSASILQESSSGETAVAVHFRKGGRRTVICDLSGRALWSQPWRSEFGAQAGDLDGDGRSEIALLDKEGMNVYSWEGAHEVSLPIKGYNFVHAIRDAQGGQSNELIVVAFNWSKRTAYVFNGRGNLAGQWPVEFEWRRHYSLVDWPPNHSQNLLFCGGKTTLHIVSARGEPLQELTGMPAAYSLAWAEPVRVASGEECLVVLAEGTGGFHQHCVLVYAADGRLLGSMVGEDNAGALLVSDAARGEILVGGRDVIWMYRVSVIGDGVVESGDDGSGGDRGRPSRINNSSSTDSNEQPD